MLAIDTSVLQLWLHCTHFSRVHILSSAEALFTNSFITRPSIYPNMALQLGAGEYKEMITHRL